MHFFYRVFFKHFLSIFLFFIPVIVFSLDNFNDLEVIGKPEHGGINFQPAVTELARDILWLDNFLLVIITLISLFVLGLLIYVCLRFKEDKNPVPSKTSHKTSHPSENFSQHRPSTSAPLAAETS